MGIHNVAAAGALVRGPSHRGGPACCPHHWIQRLPGAVERWPESWPPWRWPALAGAGSDGHHGRPWTPGRRHDCGNRQGGGWDGVGTVSDFAKSLMQNCGFIMAGFALFWHLVRTGSMSIDEALGVSIGFAALDKIWWCINWAGPLKQGITGPLVQTAIQMAAAYCLYNDINAQDVAKYYGMYGIVLGAIGYAFPKALLEAHGIEMADDPISKEMLKSIMINTGMMGLFCINAHTGGGATNALGAMWFVNMINCYMGIANEDWKKMGMASATPFTFWLALSLVMVLSAGGACF